MSDAPTLSAARWLRDERGFSVIPIDHPDDPIATEPSQVGKTPAGKWKRFQTARATNDNLRDWFGNGRRRNVAIVTGKLSGVVAVDGDSDDALAWMRAHLPPTEMRTATHGGREHWYFRHPSVPVSNKARIFGNDGLAIDVRGDGGYCVAPPSKHRSGADYARLGSWPAVTQLPVFDVRWLAPAEPDVPAAKTRQSTAATADDRGMARARAYLAKVEPAVEGQGGDAHTFVVACRLVRDFGLSTGDARMLLGEWNLTCQPPWCDRVLDAKIDGALKYGTGPIGSKLHEDRPGWAPRNAGATPDASRPAAEAGAVDVSEPDFNLTEAAAARRFAVEAGESLRFDHRRGRWLVWDRHRWTPDTNGRAIRVALDCARRWQHEAADLTDRRRKNDVFAWALKLEARAKLENMLALARNLEPVADPGDGWDSDPWLLGVRNGVVDLRTGLLRDGRREDRITQQAGARFDPAAECPRFRRYLLEVMSGNDGLVDYLHRVVGYLLTGLVTEQCFWILVGKGSNGKSTLVRALLALLGEYGCSSPFETFSLHRQGSIPNDIAAFVGRRLVEASEAVEGMRLNEALIKRLTGGDVVTARFLNCEFFSYEPAFKLLLCTNHKPTIRDSSLGFWRRCRLVRFDRTFTPDATLAGSLDAEREGILAWAIDGCLSWQVGGLNAPADVAAATHEYEADSDPLRDFIDQACEMDPPAEVGANDLYEHYCAWAQRAHMGDRERMTATAFGRRVAERFARRKTARGWVYSGVARTE